MGTSLKVVVSKCSSLLHTHTHKTPSGEITWYREDVPVYNHKMLCNSKMDKTHLDWAIQNVLHLIKNVVDKLAPICDLDLWPNPHNIKHTSFSTFEFRIWDLNYFASWPWPLVFTTHWHLTCMMDNKTLQILVSFFES